MPLRTPGRLFFLSFRRIANPAVISRLESVFPEHLVEVGDTSAYGHGDGLGFVREGGEDYSHFERYSVDGGQGQGYDEVEGPEASRDRDKPAEAPCYHEEQCVYRSQAVKPGHRAHGGCAHGPVHQPYQQGMEEKFPFAFHLQTREDALKKSLAYTCYGA